MNNKGEKKHIRIENTKYCIIVPSQVKLPMHSDPGRKRKSAGNGVSPKENWCRKIIQGLKNRSITCLNHGTTYFAS